MWLHWNTAHGVLPATLSAGRGAVRERERAQATMVLRADHEVVVQHVEARAETVRPWPGPDSPQTF
jgi:hypothetical protein